MISSLEDVGEGPYKLLFDTDEEELPYDLQKMQEDITANTSDILSLNSRLTYYTNNNLIDNWYFVEPVRQVGLTGEQPANGTGFKIVDRWNSYGNDGSKIEWIENTGLKLSDGAVIFQKFEYELIGKTVTLSILTTDQFVTSTGTAVSGEPYATTVAGANNLWAGVNLVNKSVDVTGNCTFIAIKLEIGDTQTLVHKDSSNNNALNDSIPNKSIELLKCQRYMVVLGKSLGYTDIGSAYTYNNNNNNNMISLQVPLHVPLRSSPAVSIIDGIRLTYVEPSGVLVYKEVLTSDATVYNFVEGIDVVCNIFIEVPNNVIPNNIQFCQVDTNSGYVILDSNL